jgi:hypothetical protein
MGAGKALRGATGFPFFPHPQNTSERRKIKKKAGIFLDKRDCLMSP